MEEVISRAASRGTAVTRDDVREYKAEVMRAEDCDPLTAGTFDEAGGLDGIREYFAGVIEELRAGKGQGIMMLGPPSVSRATAERLRAIVRRSDKDGPEGA